MKIDAKPVLRTFFAGALLLFLLAVAAGCEKATLGDGLADGFQADDFHGAGWAEEGRHGLEFMAETASCASCHGENLEGGVSAVSCDACHAGWESDCTFCHGGMDNDTGAPPFGVKGETDRGFAAVGAHSAHVEGTESHVAFPCDVCHGRLLTSYEDEGHLDGGQVAAEVMFSGLSANGARYDRGTATCSQLYCHGDGQTRSGSLHWTSDVPMGCDACHGDRDNPDGMSGWHGFHLRLNQFGCEACHAPVVDAQGHFVDRALHVNGQKDVGMEDGSYDPGTRTCSTGCHETVAAWSEGYHPEGWDDPTKHGYAFFRDVDSCKNCHGTLLLGGDSGISCDSCHTDDTPAWRSDCTFCHGGVDNPTGAPPEGSHGETVRTSAAVGAHTAHVQEADTHVAYDCTMCHSKPDSFDEPNHIDTNNGAEMQFAALAGTGAAYSPSTTRCNSVYCHGDGRAPSEEVAWTMDMQVACNSCHGDQRDPQGLSGAHATHLGQVGCADCHGTVVSAAGELINKSLHINGWPDVEIVSGGYDPDTMTCTTECHAGKIPWTGALHPGGWSESTQHGFAFHDDPTNCRSCHGQDLTGGTSGDSCDSCHTGGTPAWRSDCTFCHGGVDNLTGAPPGGVHGETARNIAEVGAHTAHVQTTNTHDAYDCTMCHTKPTSFDEPNHIDTNNGAEMRFATLAGSGVVYSPLTTRCASVYCHGNGITPSGQVDWTADMQLACNSCHGYQGDPKKLSGGHATHLAQVGCDECHGAVVSSTGEVVDKGLHINGRPDVRLAAGGSFDPGRMTCTTECHGGEIPWEGAYHPQGWSESTQHGFAFLDDPANCESCHGQNLTGGTSGASCDSCHTAGTPAWRTDCTFCHGGVDNGTGAPPEGVHGETARSLAEVGAHTAHVQDTATHAAYDCTMCHSETASFDEPNHIDTNNGAEMRFGSLAGSGATYSPSTTRCESVYCHGNGRTPSGPVDWTADIPLACNACHGYTTNARTLSGDHGLHISEGVSCGSCHAAVVSNSGTITNKGLHTNGVKNVSFSGGGVYDASTRRCSSTSCHGGTETW